MLKLKVGQLTVLLLRWFCVASWNPRYQFVNYNNLSCGVCKVDTSRQCLMCYKLCCYRQVNGYCGRTSKPPDSCYSFWIGATLDLLGAFSLSDVPSTRSFLLNSCQYMISFAMRVDGDSDNGGDGSVCSPNPPVQYCTRCGFCKVPNYPPDVLHTFYSLAWLSMSKSLDVDPDGDSVDEISSLNEIDPLTGLCGKKKLLFSGQLE